uniref:7TM_GPCR_Srx domain-containing protein n=1 Tax=Rhabditophanes sp. KR3021 TaxID=114890 RepID=A0AC35TWW7_9BILA
MDMYGYVGMAETWLGFVMNIFCFSYIHWKPPPSKNDFLIVVKWMRILDASIVFFYGILSMPKPIFPTCVIIIYGPVKFLGPVVSNLAVGAGLLSTQAVTVAILISYIVRHNVFVRGVKTFDFIYPDKIALSLYITFVMIPFFPLWSQILLDRDEIEETFFVILGQISVGKNKFRIKES